MKLVYTVPMALTLLGACSEPTPVGHWVGETTQAASETGSTRVEIHIAEVSESGAFTGTIVFGEPGALPPATDPDLGYPEDAFGPASTLEVPMVVESFAYTLSGFFVKQDGVLIGGRNKNEVWNDWCELQTSFADSDGEGFGCLPHCGSSSNFELDECFLLCGSPPDVPVDCGKLALCHGIQPACACYDDGCSVSGETTSTFELAFDGDTIEGSFYELGVGSLRRQ